MRANFFVISLLLILLLPLTISAQRYGSFGNISTAGMYYDEIDIMYPRPFEMLRYKDTVLLTTLGNYQSTYAVSAGTPYQRYLDWEPTGSVNAYYAAGIIGKPLWLLKMDSIRGGVFFLKQGTVNSYFDLDKQGLPFEAEGKWLDTVNYDDGSGVGQAANDGVIDRTETHEFKDMKYYEDTSDMLTQVGAAYPLSESFAVGLGFNVQRQINTLTTGGEKTFTETVPSAALPSRTNFYVKYPEQDSIDRNSVTDYDLNLGASVKLSDIFEVQACLITGLHFESNPDNEEISVIEIAASYVSPGDPTKQDTRTETINVSELGYTNTCFSAGNILNDSGTLGVTKYENDLGGLDLELRLRAEYDYDKTVLLTPSLSCDKRFGMSYESKKVEEYKFTEQEYVAGLMDSYSHTIEQETERSDGSDTDIGFGGGLKIDFLKLKKVKLAMEFLFDYDLDTRTYTEEVTVVESWTYDDPAVVNPAGGFFQVGNGAFEGSETATDTTTTEYERDIRTITWTLPVGTVIPLSKKWNLKAGAVYQKTYTKTEETREFVDGQQSRSYTSTASAGSTNSEVVMNITESTRTSRQEANWTFYSYGVEYNYNESFKLEFNAFLDTAVGTILELATYRQLAISGTYRY